MKYSALSIRYLSLSYLLSVDGESNSRDPLFYGGNFLNSLIASVYIYIEIRSALFKLTRNKHKSRDTYCVR